MAETEVFEDIIKNDIKEEESDDKDNIIKKEENKKEEEKVENILNEVPENKSNLLENIIKNSTYKEEEIETQTEEQKVILKLNEINKELSEIKNNGNNYFKTNELKTAEELYMNGIEKYETFKNENLSLFESNSENIKKILKEINSYNTAMNGNLSVIYYLKKDYQKAIDKALYVINECDRLHFNSYQRVLRWYIELKKYEQANNFAEIIKNQFKDWEKYDELKESFKTLNNINKNKNKNSYIPWILGSINLVSIVALGTLLYKHGKKFI